jgi:hypothetical protein
MVRSDRCMQQNLEMNISAGRAAIVRCWAGGAFHLRRNPCCYAATMRSPNAGPHSSRAATIRGAGSGAAAGVCVDGAQQQQHIAMRARACIPQGFSRLLP